MCEGQLRSCTRLKPSGLGFDSMHRSSCLSMAHIELLGVPADRPSTGTLEGALEGTSTTYTEIYVPLPQSAPNMYMYATIISPYRATWLDGGVNSGNVWQCQA